MSLSDEEANSSGEEEPQKEAPDRYDRLERLKREKRLAQNRDCARARRRRKKMRMELLENRVQQLTQQNTALQQDNDTLVLRVTQLEGELRRTMSMTSMQGAMGGAGVLPKFNAGLPMMGGANPNLPEERNLNMRAAMGLGGATSTTGLGAMPGGPGGPNADSIRYWQLMQQAKNSFTPAGGPGNVADNPTLTRALLAGQHGGDNMGMDGNNPSGGQQQAQQMQNQTLGELLY